MIESEKSLLIIEALESYDSIKKYQKASEYVEKAKKETHYLTSLAYWQSALDIYKSRLERRNNNGNLNDLFKLLIQVFLCQSQIKKNENEHLDVDSILNYSLCLIRLARYSEALEVLEKYKTICDKMSRYWLYKAQICRKLLKFADAKIAIDKAEAINETAIASWKGRNKKVEVESHIDFMDQEKVYIKNELHLIHKWKVYLRKNQISEYENLKATCDFEYFSRHQNYKKSYRILSIDSGGIRGIIPAIWLCEIEKRANRPISHLFNLVAGTSTGGIIAAGLSVPRDNDRYTPRFRAYDILDIFLNQNGSIYKRNGGLQRLLLKNKYDDEEKQNKFVEYFDTLRLADSLNDLVLPALNKQNSVSTYLFNRYDARTNLFKNDTYVDALMATTVTPTYFQSHHIAGKGLFKDDVIHANNPTSIACGEALRYGVALDQLYVLSLGTGGLTAPIHTHNKNINKNLFWSMNINDTILESQIVNTDEAVHYLLKDENYRRLQVSLEKKILLDDHEKDSLDQLIEYAFQFIEDNDDLFNQIVRELKSCSFK